MTFVSSSTITLIPQLGSLHEVQYRIKAWGLGSAAQGNTIPIAQRLGEEICQATYVQADITGSLMLPIAQGLTKPIAQGLQS